VIPKPIVLIILDGWGYNPGHAYNAIEKARAPAWNRLWAENPHAILKCTGRDVGLPSGTMGNSEVGHLNLGAGRVVWQDITRIDVAIEDGSFYDNPALAGAAKHAKDSGGALHLAGLLSTGNVHSCEGHYLALLELARRAGLPSDRVFFHAFTDGRDTPPTSGIEFIRTVEAEIRELGIGRVATVCGRFYAMDRDKNWNLVEQAYRCLVDGQGARADSAEEAFRKYYDNPTDARFKAGDEFILPTVIGDPSEGRIRDGDAFIFFNFRADRGRELTHAFVDEEFKSFARGRRPKLNFVTMTQYAQGLPVAVAFPPQELVNVLAQRLSEAGKRQLHCAETQKYAHVTFFLNGGIENAFPGEDRLLVPSIKEVTYDRWPSMSAGGVMDGVLAALFDRHPISGMQYSGREPPKSGYDFIAVNFANGDMVGHTGDFIAAVRAIEAVDDALGAITEALAISGGAAIITADHGNSDDLWDEANNCRHTAHTMNPVPLVLFDKRFKDRKLREDGRLADVTPTLLEMMDMAPAPEMDGRSLIIK
jgi:2,3-bisphosphoglycerate-independent phosphoglycerate mutase